MGKTKLKPCPFCGEQPHLDRHDIFCDCGVKVDIPAWDNGENDFPTYEEARQEMIDIWNTRVETEEVKALKDKINYLYKEIERIGKMTVEQDRKEI